MDELLEFIKARGLRVGSRWAIIQEGKNLAIRDMLSTERGADSRYLLFKGTHHDVWDNHILSFTITHHYL